MVKWPEEEKDRAFYEDYEFRMGIPWDWRTHQRLKENRKGDKMDKKVSDFVDWEDDIKSTPCKFTAELRKMKEDIAALKENARQDRMDVYALLKKIAILCTEARDYMRERK